MKIGYPCVNRSAGCSSSHRFRLASYSDERLKDSVSRNLACLKEILIYNTQRNILFFRISSGLIPFASHPVCTYPWQEEFEDVFAEIGDYIRRHSIRISMHPDQFVLLNSPDEEVFRRSQRELMYHAAVLDLLSMDRSAKIQIHVGGVYNDPAGSMKRFIGCYDMLGEDITKHLVVENDDHLYSAADCLSLHERTGIPVLLDVFHHSIFGYRESLYQVAGACGGTWRSRDGIPMVDYSSQEMGKRPGSHAESLVSSHFSRFLEEMKPLDFDVMLEIKDKEKSAEIAVNIAREDKRLIICTQ